MCPVIKISLQRPALILLLLVHMVCLELAAVQSREILDDVWSLSNNLIPLKDVPKGSHEVP